jgi:DNA-directed RNA polymerase sigma subunit (sigma70/sigma32)
MELGCVLGGLMPTPQKRPLRRNSDKVKQELMRPEARLMSVIFQEWLDDDMLHQKVAGMSLREALLGQIESIEQALGNSGSPAFASRCKRLAMLRFGFVDGRSWLQREIADEFGVTPERVRQIESRLLRILRLRYNSQLLKRFIKD